MPSCSSKSNLLWSNNGAKYLCRFYWIISRSVQVFCVVVWNPPERASAGWNRGVEVKSRVWAAWQLWCEVRMEDDLFSTLLPQACVDPAAQPRHTHTPSSASDHSATFISWHFLLMDCSKANKTMLTFFWIFGSSLSSISRWPPQPVGSPWKHRSGSSSVSSTAF